MWELFAAEFFLFHLSLLLSILWASVSRFVKPVCLFSSKVVGFREDKNKQCFRIKLGTVIISAFYSSFKDDYMPLSKIVIIKSLC